MKCQKDDESGWKWGESGVCFTGSNGRNRAAAVGRAIHAQGNKLHMKPIETKRFGGHIIETKQEERNGVPVGIVSGHIAAWSPDMGGIYGMPDRFHPGAFLKSLDEHRSRGNRQIRMKDHHGRTIGGFPIETTQEDAKGLFARGEINLETQLGREAYSLARQRVLTDFSIGFVAIEDKIDAGFREIFEAKIIEGSIVDEPMNVDANITEVKVAIPFQDLPLAERMTSWNPQAAKDRVKDFTESKGAPSGNFKQAFIWLDEERVERFDGYKLQIADVIDEKMLAVPRAIVKAANEVLKRDVGIPDEDVGGVTQHIERYYAKMGLVSPFSDDEKQFFGVEEIKNFTCRDMERALRDSGAFSKSAAVELAGKFNGLKNPESAADILKVLDRIRI
jgi:HK97 family phage prohead protease